MTKEEERVFAKKFVKKFLKEQEKKIPSAGQGFLGVELRQKGFEHFRKMEKALNSYVEETYD